MNASTTSPTPTPELAALVAQVHALSKLALNMTRLTMDISNAIPDVVAAEVARAIDDATPPGPMFLHGIARTPNQIDALFPLGTGDHQAWYVVVVGREPGLYGSSVETDAQVNGIPNQFRRRKTSRREALDFYRQEYNAGRVDKITEVPGAAPCPAPVIAAPVVVTAPAAAPAAAAIATPVATQ
ncbi:hypothetical protein B0H17DRAFT_1199197 [Mycena rosella]|uniref:Uncharacterized protein n=1 Tax=Mycena rosella TaxID=1033263 RepID=A0AAD7DMI6_MYCRO|nr:hypothetical protein B0H17DRAFT_1221537 [Mycena rosella]KAJ7625418.1 hypothetical protein B0H17DRAFT_1218765 [Mycena rosella]KAJ7694676.1 hypothetical protein B0H17DRAFT_1199197 [Mycena rosella]